MRKSKAGVINLHLIPPLANTARGVGHPTVNKKCGPCSRRSQCTSAAFRSLVIHQNEPARQRARELANTPEFAKAQRQRKKESGSTICGAQEPNRTASLAPAPLEVCTRAILVSSDGSEHQATGSVSHSGDNTRTGRYHLVRQEQDAQEEDARAERSLRSWSFSTPAGVCTHLRNASDPSPGEGLRIIER